MCSVRSTSKYRDFKVADTLWFTFKCRLPKAVLDLLETELERIRLLANIDPDDELPEDVVAGLCLELIVANSANTPDESVI